jgi:hypothetical protein
MKTYNITINRTYSTQVQLTEESTEDALNKLKDVNIYQIEMEQCNVIEEKIDVENELTIEEKAILWFESKGIKTSYGLKLAIITASNGVEYYMELSDSEIAYRAGLWESRYKNCN